jgi:HSP20 family protein
MMKKIFLLSLFLANSAMAYQHNAFNPNLWSNFNKQFQQFDDEIRTLQHQNSSTMQSRRYFNAQTNNYIIELKIHGLSKENLDIFTRENKIYINADVQKMKKSAHSSHSFSSQFSQSYSLPNDADEAHIDAEFKENRLIISIPKLSKIKPLVNKITIR